MKRGTHITWPLCLAGLSLASACTTENQGIKVRAIESASSKIKGGPAGLAEAQGLLNLGNPGLALEAFRKVLREQPSAEALAGIAACYAAMGRDDLAKANLEAALAFAPKAPELLQSVAVVMDRLDLKEEAATARHQAVEVAAQPAAAPTAVAAAAPTTVPAAVPKAERAEPPVVLAQPSPPPRPPAPPIKLDIAVDPIATSIASVPDVRDVVRAVAEARRLVETQNLSASVTVKLPAARMASAAPATVQAAPRLERISPREVALVTTAKPLWAPTTLKRTQASLSGPRWTPLRYGSAEPNIRLLNAARIQGLASAARSGLVQRGWRRIEVGDHAAVRARSIVLYPADKRRIGTSLARHFGIASAQSPGRTVTIILGRDFANRRHG